MVVISYTSGWSVNCKWPPEKHHTTTKHYCHINQNNNLFYHYQILLWKETFLCLSPWSAAIALSLLHALWTFAYPWRVLSTHASEISLNGMRVNGCTQTRAVTICLKWCTTKNWLPPPLWHEPKLSLFDLHHQPPPQPDYNHFMQILPPTPLPPTNNHQHVLT